MNRYKTSLNTAFSCGFPAFLCLILVVGCGDVAEDSAGDSSEPEMNFVGSSGVPPAERSLLFPDATLGGGETTSGATDVAESIPDANAGVGETTTEEGLEDVVEASPGEDTASCTPDCEGKQCGDNGCGGICGLCGIGTICQGGACIDSNCEPQCAGKVCGDNGCGGLCGTCPGGEFCDEGVCQAGPCQSDCIDKSCGDDGCGGSCGDCGDDEVCNEGSCEEGPDSCISDCAEKACGDDGCGGLCGECEPEEMCTDDGLCEAVPPDCIPSCLDKECGSDGCGGDCGTCGEGKACSEGTCVCSLCSPGAIQEKDGEACEQCGVWLMQSVCQPDCSWSELENVQCIEQGECVAGTQEFGASEKCGLCGTASTFRTCSESCSWGPWENGLCTDEGECAPGEQEFAKSASCGNCGNTESSRICSETCEWSAFSFPVCNEEDSVCVPGIEQQTEPCGNCGIRTRTCESNCDFGPWSECADEGVCSPGETDCKLIDLGTLPGGGSVLVPYICDNQCEFVVDVEATLPCDGPPGGETGGGECFGDSQVCLPGSPQEESCGNCGTRTRTCLSDGCGWGDWSDCGDQGCTPGDVLCINEPGGDLPPLIDVDISGVWVCNAQCNYVNGDPELCDEPFEGETGGNNGDEGGSDSGGGGPGGGGEGAEELEEKFK